MFNLMYCKYCINMPIGPNFSYYNTRNFPLLNISISWLIKMTIIKYHFPISTLTFRHDTQRYFA